MNSTLPGFVYWEGKSGIHIEMYKYICMNLFFVGGTCVCVYINTNLYTFVYICIYIYYKCSFEYKCIFKYISHLHH
jgi:hypothetical protein